MTHLIAAFSTDLEAKRVSTVESDFLAHTFIPKELLERDLPLYDQKWFDYRMMTPVQATHAYMIEYAKVYRRIYAREFDFERAEHLTPISFDAILAVLNSAGRNRHPDNEKKAKNAYAKAKRAFTGCWHGRQIADFLCMPYAEYIDMAFTFRMRAWQQPTMPQPCQLYRDIEVEKIVVRWEEMREQRIHVAEHSAYMVQNYAGLKHQNDYHEYLFEMAMKRADPAGYLADFVNNDRLPLSKVKARLEPAMFLRVERALH